MNPSSRVSRETGLAIGLLFCVVTLWWLWGTQVAPWMASNLAKTYSQNASLALEPEAKDPPKEASAASGVQAAASAASAPAKPSVGDFFTRLGQTGDLFGGVNALFASAALVGVFWAGALQRRAMLEARAAIGHQHFETAFFELLKLTREVVDRFEYAYVPERAEDRAEKVRNGFRALNALTVRTFSKEKRFPIPGTPPALELQHLVNVFKRDVYRQYPSALGPFFRVLYQTFVLVSKAPIEEGEKIRYSNIARGQLTEASILLLALNGLTWRGWKFVPLIEQFGLLEHMHPEYLQRLEPILRLAYRERAFAGSEERESLANESAPVPGPYAFDRDPSQPDFEVSQAPEDIEATLE